MEETSLSRRQSERQGSGVLLNCRNPSITADSTPVVQSTIPAIPKINNNITSADRILFQKFILGLAKALYMTGAPTYRVEQRIESIARAADVPLEINCQPNIILISFGTAETQTTQSPPLQPPQQQGTSISQILQTQTQGQAVTNGFSYHQTTFFIKVSQSFDMKKLQQLDYLAKQVARYQKLQTQQSNALSSSPDNNNDTNDDTFPKQTFNPLLVPDSTEVTPISPFIIDQEQDGNGRKQYDRNIFSVIYDRLKRLKLNDLKRWFKRLKYKFKTRVRFVVPISVPDATSKLTEIMNPSDTNEGNVSGGVGMDRWSVWKKMLKQAISNGVFSMSLAMLTFRGGPDDAFVAFILGILTGSLTFLHERYEIRAKEVWIPFFISICAHITAYVNPKVCLGVPLLASLVTLFPGVSITLAMLEFASDNMNSGSVRMFYSFVRSLQLGFGMSLGSRLAKYFTGIQPSIASCSESSANATNSTDSTDTTATMTMATIASYLFVYLLIVPYSIAHCIQVKASFKRQWPFMLFTASMGYITLRVSSSLFTMDIATVLSSFMIGLLSNMYSRLANDLALPYVLCGIMLLVPGAVGIVGFYEIMRGQDGISTTSFAMDMIVRAMGIALGLYVSSLIYSPMKKSGQLKSENQNQFESNNMKQKKEIEDVILTL